MPDTPINVLQPMRFEAGGIFRIQDGATDYAVRNLEQTGLRIKFAGREALTWIERGQQKTPLEGNEQLAEIELEMKVSKKEATGLFELLFKRNTVANQGLVYVYTVQIDTPYYDGSATGHRYPFTGVWVDKDSVEQQQGADFDTIRFRMRGLMGTVTTF
jgi:hypothetical protein